MGRASAHPVWHVQRRFLISLSLCVCTRASHQTFKPQRRVCPPSQVLNLDRPRNASGRVQISSTCVHGDLLVVGGFWGELVAKRLTEPDVAYATCITHDDSAITNAVEVRCPLGFNSRQQGVRYRSITNEACGGGEQIFEMPGGGSTRVLTSSNDSIARVFDATTFQCLQKQSFGWAVNYSSPSPDRKLLAVVGDHPDGLLADFNTGQVVASLKGHMDFSFAVAWHPNGFTFATGNQDATTRIWDLRFLASATAVLPGRIGAIRSLRFSPDGRLLAMAEPADFVHLFDVRGDFRRSQVIDIFGEVAGIAFSPDSESFFVGTEDQVYGSLMVTLLSAFAPRPACS